MSDEKVTDGRFADLEAGGGAPTQGPLKARKRKAAQKKRVADAEAMAGSSIPPAPPAVAPDAPNKPPPAPPAAAAAPEKPKKPPLTIDMAEGLMKILVQLPEGSLGTLKQSVPPYNLDLLDFAVAGLQRTLAELYMAKARSGGVEPSLE